MLGPSLASRPSVGILGAGTQGRRLAFMWTSQGRDVHLIDSQQSQLNAGVKAVEEFRARGVAPRSSRPGAVLTHAPSGLKDALQNCWLVVECLPEKLSIKKNIIAELDAVAPKDSVIASNSSSYSCDEILEGLDLRHQDRVLSAHTYWPPETPAIEIMGHGDTNQSLVKLMLSQCELHGFTPFHVKKPSMGYLYNRIWASIKREALMTAAEGAGTPAEIDAIFKSVLKTPKGPFEQMDIVGLDVVYDIEQHYADARPGLPTAPREYLQKYLDRGDLGVKSGKGFFEYPEQS